MIPTTRPSRRFSPSGRRKRFIVLVLAGLGLLTVLFLISSKHTANAAKATAIATGGEDTDREPNAGGLDAIPSEHALRPGRAEVAPAVAVPETETAPKAVAPAGTSAVAEAGDAKVEQRPEVHAMDVEEAPPAPKKSLVAGFSPGEKSSESNYVQPPATHPASGKSVRAEIITCPACRLNSLPLVKRFVKEIARFFTPALVVTYISGKVSLAHFISAFSLTALTFGMLRVRCDAYREYLMYLHTILQLKHPSLTIRLGSHLFTSILTFASGSAVTSVRG